LDGDIELFLAITELLTGERISYWQHERLDWNQHVEKLLHENPFHIGYHMSLEDFDALVQLLGDEVVPNFAMSPSLRCDKAIYPEMMVAIGIRVLASGNYDGIMKYMALARVVSIMHEWNKFVDAVLLNFHALDIDLRTKVHYAKKQMKVLMNNNCEL
jgi:hypothetical protein